MPSLFGEGQGDPLTRSNSVWLVSFFVVGFARDRHDRGETDEAGITGDVSPITRDLHTYLAHAGSSSPLSPYVH